MLRKLGMVLAVASLAFYSGMAWAQAEPGVATAQRALSDAISVLQGAAQSITPAVGDTRLIKALAYLRLAQIELVEWEQVRSLRQ